MTAMTRARWVAMALAVMFTVTSISLYEVIKHEMKDPSGTLTFVITPIPRNAPTNLKVLSFGSVDGAILNYWVAEDDNFPLIHTVPISSETVSVSIFAIPDWDNVSLEGVECIVTWKTSDGHIESYVQEDLWVDVTLPKCDWIRDRYVR